MSSLSWFDVFRGRNLYNDSPEQERRWVRDAFLMGFVFGVLVMAFIMFKFW